MIMNFFKALMFAALVLSAAACRPTSIDDVTRRISEGKELSQEDYRIMIDYAMESIDRTSDSIARYKDDRLALANSIKSLYVEFPEANLVANTLMTVDTTKLDESNRARYEKFMGTKDDVVRRFNDVMYGGIDPTKLIDGGVHVETSDSSALSGEMKKL